MVVQISKIGHFNKFFGNKRLKLLRSYSAPKGQESVNIGITKTTCPILPFVPL